MQLLKFSWILLLASGVGVLGFGLIAASYLQIFPDYSGIKEEDGLLRAIGVATTVMGIFGVVIAIKAYRKREKWAWFALWYYPVFWTMHLAFGLPPGDDHVHQIIFFVLSLLGLLLPVKHFFSSKSIQQL